VCGSEKEDLRIKRDCLSHTKSENNGVWIIRVKILLNKEQLKLRKKSRYKSKVIRPLKVFYNLPLILLFGWYFKIHRLVSWNQTDCITYTSL
jgi:hypothetical protein